MLRWIFEIPTVPPSTALDLQSVWISISVRFGSVLFRFGTRVAPNWSRVPSAVPGLEECFRGVRQRGPLACRGAYAKLSGCAADSEFVLLLPLLLLLVLLLLLRRRLLPNLGFFCCHLALARLMSRLRWKRQLLFVVWVAPHVAYATPRHGTARIRNEITYTPRSFGSVYLRCRLRILRNARVFFFCCLFCCLVFVFKAAPAAGDCNGN